MIKLKLSKEELEMVYKIRCRSGEEDSADDIERLMWKEGFETTEYDEKTVINILGRYVGDLIDKNEYEDEIREALDEELDRIYKRLKTTVYYSNELKRMLTKVVRNLTVPAIN